MGSNSRHVTNGRVRVVIMRPEVHEAEMSGSTSAMGPAVEHWVKNKFADEVESLFGDNGPIDGVYRVKVMEAVLLDDDDGEAEPVVDMHDYIAPSAA